MIYLLIVFLIVLLTMSAFSSGSEAALFSLSPAKILLFENDKLRSKRLAARLLKNPRDLLVTILIINIAVNIGVQNILSIIIGPTSNWWTSIVFSIILTLVFGEIIPKSLSISHNEKVVRLITPFLYTIRAVIKPIRIVVTIVASRLSSIFFFFLRKEKEISINELKHALQTSKENGVISHDELKLISGSLKIDDLMVKELMRPRQDVIHYDVNDPITTLIHIFTEKEVGCVPVVDEDIDSVIGIMTSDLYFMHRNEINNPRDIIVFLKEPLYVPETISAHNLLAIFNETKDTIALVVDEYGQISGLITKEDIVEVVVGQIEDKRDEKILYTKQSENVIISDGRAWITDVEEIFNISIEDSTSVVTIGGFLTERFGDIPKSGSKLTTNGLLFHVLSATPSRVQMVYIRKL